MLARLRSNWFAIRASYWFYPALFALTGFILALFLVHLDQIGATGFLMETDLFTPARPDGANNILTVLSGSMIGVASTVFSITIAAVAYASGTYGPRILTNFMEDKGNQLSLATFIGTFVYAITVLHAVRTADEAAAANVPGDVGFVPQLALLAAFALMMIAVSVLVYFLHHVPSSIRINTVIEHIGERLLHDVAQRYPERGGLDPVRRAMPMGAAIAADRAGYVRLIEHDALRDAAREMGILVGVQVRSGDFVYPGIPLARIDAEHAEPDVIGRIRDHFAVGGSRTPEQDLEFSIDELVEIALRALSPGINDPFTAITAIHWLGAVIAEFGRRNLHEEVWAEGEQDCPLFVPRSDFAHFVERSFASARASIASNRLTAIVALQALAAAHDQVIGDERRALLAGEARGLADLATGLLCEPDAAHVEDVFRTVREKAGF